MSARPQTSITALCWLIAAVAAVSAPHIPYISPWITALLLLTGAWRLLAGYRRWALPSGWLRVPLALLGLIGVMFTYRRISGVEAGSALLLVMLALKLLETRDGRDHTLVALICFFLVFAGLLREQEIWSLAYLFVGVVVTLCALLHSRFVGTPLGITPTVKQSLTLLAQAVPLMALLFILFPRVPGPFWALPAGGGAGVTGLSDTVSPGDITSLGRSDAVAFRVRFNSTVPAPRERYWRGPVMSYFNGRTWSWQDRGVKPQMPVPAAGGGELIDYELTLEPHGRHWLLALESPAEWNAPRAYLSAGFQLLSRTAVRQRIAYRARSSLQGRIPADEEARHLQAMTFLPPGSNPRARELAIQLRDQSIDDQDYLRRVLQKFRSEAFYYTLAPAALHDDPVDEFLFETREGFCEHYASAFAVLARAAGIPARLVTGYQGAEKNPLADYWIVRQSNAHAWTELWLDDAWVRFDPTAAVAPERIELSLEAALPASERAAVARLRRLPVFNRLALSWDAVNAAWNQWVLGFGPETQRSLLKKFGFSRPEFTDMVLAMTAGCALFLAGLAVLLRRSGEPPVDPVLRLYRRFCRRLAGIARPRRPGEAPSIYAQAVSHARPDLANDVGQIVSLYLRLRYDGLRDAQSFTELVDRVRRFRPSRA